MARPRVFDTQAAIEGAMQIFWQQGYTATNLPDLLTAMGLTRGSFYKAFGNKRAAYVEALKLYERTHIDKASAMLKDAAIGSGRARIEALFEAAFGELHARETRRGCLVCNAMVELAPIDKEVAALTAGMFAKLQKAVHRALSDDRNGNTGLTAEKAALIAHSYFGAQAVSKAGEDLPDWRKLLGLIAGH